MGDDWDDCELFSSRMGGGCMMLDRYVMCVSLRKSRLCGMLCSNQPLNRSQPWPALEIGWEYGAWNCVYIYILYTLTVSTYTYCISYKQGVYRQNLWWLFDPPNGWCWATEQNEARLDTSRIVDRCFFKSERHHPKPSECTSKII